MTTIYLWSDFACPYCYIGETRLKRAIEDLGLQNDIEIHYRAFELDPTASKEVTTTTPERFAMKYRLSLDDAKKQIEQISQLGRELGIDFRYADTKYSNTLDAHRLMKLAEDKYDAATVERLNDKLFAAYFTENLVLANHDVLIAKAAEAGMDKEEVKQMLKSDKYYDDVRFDEREAAMRGVHGVPYIVFNGHFAVPGAMSIDGFKSALQREMAKQKKEKEESPNEKAHACTEEGCLL
ncbi:MAG: DsbA family oxidoreductase [Muribaculaceae bacterium]|nr:DsbA family oxidoreductase [Muribaculaceae bacterium]